MTQILNSKPNVFGYSNLKFGYYLPRSERSAFYYWGLGFRILCLGFFFIAFVPNANAGLIFKAPSSIGLISGLVGYWSFDGPDMAGNIAYDRSGSYATGTLTNGPTRTIGKIGQALEFDEPKSRYIDLGTLTALDVFGANQNFSISAWVKRKELESPSGQNDPIFSSGTGSGSGVIFDVGVNAPDVMGFAPLGTVNPTWVSNTRTGNADWHHVAATANRSGNITFYLDGKPDGTFNISASAGENWNRSAGVYKIGRDRGGTEYASGLLDEVRVYNRALNENEIRRLYKMGATLKVNQARYTGSLTDGLVGYWSFDGPDMAGTNPMTAYDRSGNNNSGTSTGANIPKKVIGKIGQALDFTGDGFITVNNSSTFKNSNFSISVWINPNPAAEESIVDFRGFDTGNESGYQLRIESSNSRFPSDIDCIINDSDIETPTKAIGAITASEWTNIVCAFDNATDDVKIYKNGVLVKEATGVTSNPVATNNTQPLRIGETSNVPSSPPPTAFDFEGKIDEVRIYNRALNENEIRRLYRIGGTIKINQPPPASDSINKGLVGYWSFDGPDVAATSTGSAALDRSGSNNIGYLINGPQRTIGKIGQGLSFDGKDDGVILPDSARPTNTATVSLWMYPRDVIAPFTNEAVLSSDENIAMGIEYSSSTSKFLFNIATTNNAFSQNPTSFTSAINTYHHVVWSYDGAFLSGYVDGVLGVRVAKTGNLNYAAVAADPFIIGGYCEGGPTCYSNSNGIIDEVRIYNRALTPDEIRRLYNMGR